MGLPIGDLPLPTVNRIKSEHGTHSQKPPRGSERRCRQLMSASARKFRWPAWRSPHLLPRLELSPCPGGDLAGCRLPQAIDRAQACQCLVEKANAVGHAEQPGMDRQAEVASGNLALFHKCSRRLRDEIRIAPRLHAAQPE